MGIGCNVKVNMGKLARNGKAWIFVIGVSTVTLFKVFGFAELPQKVEVLKEGLHTEIVERVDAVGQLANTVENYILKQDIIQEGMIKAQEAKAAADKSKEELLHKWIEAVSKK